MIRFFKTVAAFTCLLVLSGCTANSSYVQNPFWFPRGELYDTPEMVYISGSSENAGKTTEIRFFEYTARLPGAWKPVKAVAVGELGFKKGDQVINIGVNNKKFAFPGCRANDINQAPIIGRREIRGPSEPCSAPGNWRSYYHKLFFLTLRDYENVSVTKANFWDFYILHRKAMTLKDTHAFIHYTGNHIEAFREVRQNGTAIKIFPYEIKDDGHLEVIANPHVEEKAIEHFLGTLKHSNLH